MKTTSSQSTTKKSLKKTSKKPIQRFFVKAKANAKQVNIEKTGESRFTISVTSPREKNKANEAIIKILAKELNVAPSNLRIASGARSSNKIIELQ